MKRTPALLALLLALSLTGPLASQTIDTMAGGGPDPGPAVNRPLGTPFSVVLDAAGNRYVASVALHRVFKIDTAGQLTIVAGNGGEDFSGDGGPATAATLRGPRGVAVDALGNVFVADSGNHRIRRVDKVTGVITTVAGTGAAGFGGDSGPATAAALNLPSHIALDPSGNLYLADTLNHRIRQIAAGTGIINTVAGNGVGAYGGDSGPATSASVNQPVGIAVNAGTLYIGDTGNHRVRQVVAGTITTLAGTGVPGFGGDAGPAANAQLDSPVGIAVVGSGDIFIADFSNDRIRKVSGTTITTVAGNGTPAFGGDGGPATAASLWEPAGVAVDPASNLLIADTNNFRIRRVDGITQLISTVAGTGAPSFHGDGGPAVLAALSEPRGLARQGSDLFIADAFNHRVRKVDSAGIIDTVAGNGTFGFAGDGGPATAGALAQPSGTGVDASGHLYIADRLNHRVRRVDKVTLTITTVAGNGTPTLGGDGGLATAASLFRPGGVAVDGAGNLFIADESNHRIRRVDAVTQFITTYAGTTAGFSGDGLLATVAQLNSPVAVSLDAAGNLFIADSVNSRIRKVDAVSKVITTVAGNGSFAFGGDGGPAPLASLNVPAGIAVDGRGDLFIADQGNQRIRMVEARTGRITTVAGSSTTPGFGGDGGPATSARLHTPSGVAVDGSGRVFLADTKNQRVRSMSLGIDLAVTKDDFQSTAVPGGPVSYQIRVVNNGPLTISSVNVVDPVPPAILSPVFSPGSGSYDPPSGDWTGIVLGPGDNAVLTLSGTVSPSARGSLLNTATVSPPLGLRDTDSSNDTGSDTDTLDPSADLALGLNATPSGSVPLGQLLMYSLQVGNTGPSDATTLQAAARLSPAVAFDSASPGCTYNATLHESTCVLGSLGKGSGTTFTVRVKPVSPGTAVLQATVRAVEPDPNSSNDSGSLSTTVTLPPDVAQFFTVTSRDGQTRLEWVNPAGFDTVRIRRNPGPACTPPLGENDGQPVVDAKKGKTGRPDGAPDIGLPNTKHCYSIFVDKGGGSYSSARANSGLTFSTSGLVKWAFSIGATALAPSGVGFDGIHQVANDNSVHAVTKGEFGGTWPAGWTPQSMMGPSQGRPSTVPITVQGSFGVMFLGSQDGRVYALSAIGGSPIWSTPLDPPGSMVQAAPSGIFAAFGPGVPYNYILVGTRHATADNRFYALDVQTGTPVWWVDGSGPINHGRIGVISGQAAVDYPSRLVYFTSRRRNGLPTDNTVWCVNLDTGLVKWAQALGDIDASPSLRGDRLYVGTTGGEVRALKAGPTGDGTDLWAAPFATGDGPVKGGISFDRFSDEFYFSTTRTLWRLRDGGATPPQVEWSRTQPDPDFDMPSSPVLQPGGVNLWVGSDKNGWLLRIDPASGNTVDRIKLGDGQAVVGSPTIDVRDNYLYVGTDAGVVYSVQMP